METKNRITIGYAFMFLAYAGYYREKLIICLLGSLLSIATLAIDYKSRKPKLNTYILMVVDFALLGYKAIDLEGFLVILTNIICIYLVLPYLKDKECRLVTGSLVFVLVGMSIFFYVVNIKQGYDNIYYLDACGMLFMLCVPLLLGIVDNRVINQIALKSKFVQR